MEDCGDNAPTIDETTNAYDADFTSYEGWLKAVYAEVGRLDAALLSQALVAVCDRQKKAGLPTGPLSMVGEALADLTESIRLEELERGVGA